MNSKTELRSKLQNKLRELFQFNISDLDFGIYRILNQKKDEIESFIEKDLLNAIDKGLEEYTQDDESQLDDLKQEINTTLGERAFENGGLAEKYQETPLGKKYLQAKEKADKQEVGEEIEKRIYQDLHTFFTRYYDDGDFLTQRRISTRDSKYAIPYNGEEVKLHWANKDQYYIKTGEHFANYKFDVNGLHVWFKVQNAEVEKDNVKESDTRYFVLRPEDSIEIDEENDTLTLWFEYRPLKDEEEKQWLEIYNQAAGKSLKTIDRKRLCIAFDDWVRSEVTGRWRNALSTMPDNKEYSLLYNKLNHFTAKNTTDFFIHKNLQEFLERELEYYLKHEVIQVDDFIKADSAQPLRTALTRAKVLRVIAEKVITFLSQIEDFQKKLFEKKKFVVDTHYCVTLDKVPEELYETILKNEQQLEYWEDCYSMNQWENNLEWNGEWTKVVLKNHPFMMVDTKFFEDEFKYDLMASFDDLEEELGGLLVNSENLQALNLIKSKYSNKIGIIYIDPPYNTNSSPIAYKNNYKDSSWLSLVYDRVLKSKELMELGGFNIVAIDDVELRYLTTLLDEIFHKPNYLTTITTECNPQGRVAKSISKTSEFHIIHSNNLNQSKEIFIPKIEGPSQDKVPFKRTGTNSRREERPLRFYPILEKNGQLSLPSIKEYNKIYNKDENKFNDEYLDKLINSYINKGFNVILPTLSDKSEYLVWQREFSRAQNEISSYIHENGSIYTPAFKKENPKTLWKSNYFANPEYGSETLKEILGFKSSKNTAKSYHTVRQFCHFNKSNIILDYFSGSGTTAHAVLDLNKNSESQKKYILVEVGKYFNTVLKPRIIKVSFSNDWKDGIPQNKDGQSHAFKYHFIESYEDSLNNIDFKDKDDVQQALEFDDYMLKYMLDFETKGVSATLLKDEAFETPFDYELNIQRGHESPAPEKVDLVETFHYLIGLWVKTMHRYEHQDRKYIISKGEIRDEDVIEDVLVVWRNTEDVDLEEEAEWISEEIIDNQTLDRIYVNGASKIKDAEPTEITFREKMFE